MSIDIDDTPAIERKQKKAKQKKAKRAKKSAA